jgi:UDP-N-acetylmuramoyl-L-alanyl-D-glutamate--2,6-diaminopimelate ligase
MNAPKDIAKSVAPGFLLSAYHFALAQFGAYLYGYPSRNIRVLAVTGTKGKTSTTEFLNAILEENGEKTALLNSIRIKIAEESSPNTMRMSMPGRFFIQRFLSQALARGCTTAILEMTSEGARQYRHRAIELDALIFTNLAPEHIESHGSYEAYADAKFEIGKQLVRSHKSRRIMVASGDDAQSTRYLVLPVEDVIAFSLSGATPYESNEHGGFFTFEGAHIATNMPGDFSLKNALAAATLCRALYVPTEIIARGIAKLTTIPGRAEEIQAGQDFTVVVDYAHTPDSLKEIYDAYKAKRRICVLGATGGGRDHWKRPVMGGIADAECAEVILTNEDPYDENPFSIVGAMAKGMKRPPTIIIDRRDAMARAFSIAKTGDAVLITGKGTDPCICGPKGEKIPWSDAQVAREEIAKLLAQKPTAGGAPTPTTSTI